MEKEFNLSDYVEQSGATYPDSFKLKVGKVKEAVRILKEELFIETDLFKEDIDDVCLKIFGEKLVEDER